MFYLRHKHHLFRHKASILNNPLRNMLWVSGIFFFVFNLFAPIFAIFVQRVGGNVAVAGSSSAVFMIAGGIFTFIGGRLETSATSRKVALIASQLILAVGHFLYLFVFQVETLFLAQIILGIGEGLYWPAFHAVYGKYSQGAESTVSWSLYDALSFLVPAVAAGLGGWLVSLYGFNFVFITMTILSLLAAVLISCIPRKVFEF